jgi:hypothetical protein
MEAGEHRKRKRRQEAGETKAGRRILFKERKTKLREVPQPTHSPVPTNQPPTRPTTIRRGPKGRPRSPKGWKTRKPGRKKLAALPC